MTEPYLVGWSQVSRFDGEPLDAWAEALRSTGVDPARIDSLDVVYCQSWQYDDPPRRLADAIGANPRRLHYSGIGGTTPLRLMEAAAERIRTGESDVCAIVGGEALATVRALKKAGERPPWRFREAERSPFPFEAPFHPAEVAHEVFQAYTTFALRDVARRARVGAEPDDYRRDIGELFAPFTQVAAANPNAWFPVERSADELIDVTTDNRLVAYPYTKLVVAIMDVDLVGALVLASPEAADAMGIAPDRRVSVRGTGSADDPVHVAEHPDLSTSPGLAAATARALAAGGVDADDVAYFDLYSCFPASVHFTLDALGIDPGDDRPFTVTGGLPYAGGPGSAYGLLSIAAMADRLVEDPGSVAMITAVGMHLSKHSAVALSTAPNTRTAAGRTTPPWPAVGETSAFAIDDVHTGPATIAAYTVLHGPDGSPRSGLAVCDVGERRRCYATTTDADLLDALERNELVGSTVAVVSADGVNEMRLS